MLRRCRTTVFLIAVIATFLVPTTASAQAGPTATCDSDTVVFYPGVGYDMIESVLVSDAGPNGQGYQGQVDQPVSIPAGEYEITAAAYDGGDTRPDQIQPAEQYFVQFIDAQGAVIARTPGMTAELEDEVLEAEWTGSLGVVQLDRAAVIVRAIHAFPDFGLANPNSVMPTCVGFSLVPPPTTTTTTSTTTTSTTTTSTTTSTTTTSTTTVPGSTSTTTVPASTTTEPPASTTSVPPSTTVAASTTTIASPTTVAPPTTTVASPTTTIASPTTTIASSTTTTPPTTTTVPFVVLPPVQEMPDPDPVVGTPNFTG